MGVENSQKRIAAFFDLDLTITSRDSFRYFLKRQYLYNPNNWHFIPQVSLWGVLRKLRLISLQTFKEKSLICLNNKEESFLREIGKTFFIKYLPKIIRAKALERIKWHRDRDHLIFIITSCPDIYVHHLAEYLGCDGYECSRLAYRGKKFVGKFDGFDCLGNEKEERVKAICAKNRLDLTKSYAYSDHESDLPMLKLVGNPTVILPTAKLTRIAMEKGWKIEEW